MKRIEYTDEFQLFWRLWPGRWRPESDTVIKVGKYEAFKVWQKLSTEEWDEIIALLKSGKVKQAGTQYLPDAHRWLNNRRWEDFS